jgi:hypothetical protein
MITEIKKTKPRANTDTRDYVKKTPSKRKWFKKPREK